uniref:diguanylate cyclase n=1 Tax=Aliarcobacter sp. TaxID=2321116 RepID=UPI0040477B0B
MKLSEFITRFIFSVAFISTLFTFLVSILFQFNNFEKDKVYIKNEYMELKKKELKREIETIINLIKHEEEILVNENEKIKKEHILEWISTFRFADDGYIFVNDIIDGKALVWDGKRLKEPIIHPNKMLYDLQIKSSENPDGDFLFYKFKKLDSKKEFDKLSFVKRYEPFGWLIGTGVYLDDLEKELLRKENIFKETIDNQIKSLLLIFMFILIVIYYISTKMSSYINTNINSLILSFKKASSENKKIDTNNLTYKEFVSLADNLNYTLETKNKTEKELQDYIKIVNENIIISTTDKEGKIIDVSEAFCKVSGFSKKELIGKTHRAVKHPDTPVEFYEEMWKTLLSGKEWRGEIKNKNKRGTDYWVLAIIKPIFNNNDIIGFTALRTNITNRKFIEQLSITDELTQLYNRRFFNNKIEEEINRARREKTYFSLLIIDIDYFKQYNDSYGHQKGDTALEKVAMVLKKHTNRASDFAFRLGGEEFGIIAKLEKNKAIEFAELIRSEIENLKIPHKNSKISKYLTISIGLISKKEDDIKNSNLMYKEADDSLYEAKNNGRNKIFIQ